MRKLVLVATLLLVVFTGAAFAADFPTKNIRLLVPFAAGGGTDAVARALAASAEQHLGQPVVVMNRTGGSGAVGMTEGATARADGYTVTMVTREIAWLPQMGLAQITPDDFDLLALINEDPAILLVQPGSRFSTVNDLLEAAKAEPGTIRFASTARPNFYLLALELNQGVSFNQIPYNGAAEAIPALLGGHVEFTMVNPGEAISQIMAEQLIPLGVCSDVRMAGLPDVPTMTEQGIPVVTGTWRGLAVPKGTPENVKAVLGAAFEKAAAEKDFVDFMNGRTLGIRFLNAADFRTFVDNDVKALDAVVEEVKKQQQ